MKVKYYIIHNLDPKRKEKMDNLIEKYGIPEDDIRWVLHPNKNEVTLQMREKYVQQGITTTCGNLIYYLKDGYVCCSIKHYLALKDIVENEYEYAVIIEDGIGGFVNNVPDTVEKYLSQLPEDWDILFDTNWCPYIEGEVKEDKVVYRKSNEMTNQCHGGSKLAQFYLLNLRSARKMYENYIPFNNAPDWWMNDLFRKLDFKSYWAEPANCLLDKHKVSST